MIGDKRLEEPKTDEEVATIYEMFFGNIGEELSEMDIAVTLVKLNNEVYEKMQDTMKKKVICTACNGSGHYDNDGSPKCGCCNGKGYEYK